MIPKSFIPKKKTEDTIKKLLKPPPKICDEDLDYLVEGCAKFLVHNEYLYVDAKNIVDELEYSKGEIQLFCNKLTEFEDGKYFPVENFPWAGMYLSALVNKMMGRSIGVVLELPVTKTKLGYIGTRLSKGIFVAEGDLGNFTGFGMHGGCLIVKGSIGVGTGCYMEGGELHADKIGHISDFYRGGKIYEAKKQIR